MCRTSAEKNRDKWLAASDEEFLRDCRLDFFKATGKGGQKRNKTSSATRLVHEPTGLASTASESRGQHENTHNAIKKLKLLIALSIRNDPGPPPDVGVSVSVKNPRYPEFVAALFDILHANGFLLKESAEKIGVSPSRLAKTLFRDPALWQEVGRRRQALSLPPLHG